MALRVTFHPDAVYEARDALSWYQAIDPAVSQRLGDALNAAFQLIAEFPEAAPRYYGIYRRLIIQRFPYAVFYKVDADFVDVVAVFHLSQDDKRLRRRLGSYP